MNAFISVDKDAISLAAIAAMREGDGNSDEGEGSPILDLVSAY